MIRPLALRQLPAPAGQLARGTGGLCAGFGSSVSASGLPDRLVCPLPPDSPQPTTESRASRASRGARIVAKRFTADHRSGAQDRANLTLFATRRGEGSAAGGDQGRVAGRREADPKHPPRPVVAPRAPLQSAAVEADAAGPERMLERAQRDLQRPLPGAAVSDRQDPPSAALARAQPAMLEEAP